MLLIALTIKSVSDPTAIGQFIVDGKPSFHLAFRVYIIASGKMSLNH